MKENYYTIKEVAMITSLKVHTIRYWLNEFPQLIKRKNSANKLIFTDRDVEMIINIKRLVHTEGYSIDGAKNKLNKIYKEKQLDIPFEGLTKSTLKAIIKELEKILVLLGGSYDI